MRGNTGEERSGEKCGETLLTDRYSKFDIDC